MGNGCDPELELRLRLGSGNQSSAANSNSMRLNRVADWLGNTTMYHQQPPQQQQPPQLPQQQQQITIFYNGRTCAFDVTEIQARTIIRMAMQEMEERSPTEKKSSESSSFLTSSQSRPSPLTGLAPQLIHPGLSMKRSLQRFLEKRRTRMDAASPYHCTA